KEAAVNGRNSSRGNAFLGEHRQTDRRQPVEDHRFRPLVGLGHRRAVRLVRGDNRTRIDVQDRLGGGNGGIDQVVEQVVQAAFFPGDGWRRRKRPFAPAIYASRGGGTTLAPVWFVRETVAFEKIFVQLDPEAGRRRDLHRAVGDVDGIVGRPFEAGCAA